VSNLLLRKTSLAVLQDLLLIQCGVDEAPDVWATLRTGAGLVVSSTTIKRVRSGKLRTYRGPLLIDRQRYSGVSSRVFASAGISPGWIDHQRYAGVTARLTDSGYIGQGDEAGLDVVLSQTAELGEDDVVAVLPLHPRWLNGDVELLIEAVNSYGVPIALVVEHSKDPFSVRRNVCGLVKALRSVSVPVLLLRSDISALGAIAFGALSGAVGTRPSLRHLSPMPKKPGGGGFSRGVEAALFDPGLYFVHVDKLARGVAALPEDPMWLCECQTCKSDGEGERLDWMHARATRQQVLAHNIELLLDRRDHLVSATAGGERQQVWRAACHSAEFQFTSVAVTRAGWEVPPALRYWQEV
jgi:hypothetical protein